MAELRAFRFGEFDQSAKGAILARLRKGPPRRHWPRKTDAEKFQEQKLYYSLRELRRIELAQNSMPPKIQSWIQSKIEQFPELVEMSAVDGGFPDDADAVWGAADPDARYDAVSGVDRLSALEKALSTAGDGWTESTAERADSWLRQSGNTTKVLSDFESVSDRMKGFPALWERFGWAHEPAMALDQQTTTQDCTLIEANRVLQLLDKLTDETVRSAIHGLSHWVRTWSLQVRQTELGLRVWMQMWPAAVEATNGQHDSTDDTDLSVFVRENNSDREPMDLDTLNAPAGKLVGVFLEPDSLSNKLIILLLAYGS